MIFTRIQIRRLLLLYLINLENKGSFFTWDAISGNQVTNLELWNYLSIYSTFLIKLYLAVNEEIQYGYSATLTEIKNLENHL